MAQIKFLTDSAADIPPHLVEELDIRVLRFPIIVGDAEYMDGKDFTAQEFYQLLLDTPQIPSHAQLTPFYFESVFQEIYQSGCSDLIYTSINAKASSTHQNATQARDEFFRRHPEASEKFSIHIIDSRCYAMGYGYAVIEGARRAAAGATAQEVCDFIQDWVDHVRILFAPFDLKFAKKSGRVSAAAAFMGEALGLKPLMTFQDGDSNILTKVRGERNVIPTMLKLCEQDREPGSPYIIIRANNAPQADQLVVSCRETLGQEALMEYFIGGVISINAGPNLVGLIYREK